MPLDATTAITIAGKTVWDEGVREHYGAGGNTATRVLRCAWADRQPVIVELLGGGLTRAGLDAADAPAPYPDAVGMVAADIDVEGEGLMSVGPAGMVAYERAVLRVAYRVPEYQLSQVPGLPEVGDDELETSSSAIALDQDEASFEWAGGGDIPPSAAPALSFTTVTFTRSRHNVPNLPVGLVADRADHCNSGPLFGAPAETVLFRGGRSRRAVSAAGVANWSLSYTFEKHPAGWNKLWKPGAGWTDFRKKGSGDKFFPPADLNQLFT